LARGETRDHLAIGVFLIDEWRLGVKDTFFRTIGAQSFGDMLDRMEEMVPVDPVDPAYARKLLRDVTAWAVSNGMAPHRDFAALEKLFGDVDADACDTTFTFGREDELTYIPGPIGSASQIRLTVGAVMQAGKKLVQMMAAERQRAEQRQLEHHE
jgi:hypothetical protein